MPCPVCSVSGNATKWFMHTDRRRQFVVYEHDQSTVLFSYMVESEWIFLWIISVFCVCGQNGFVQISGLFLALSFKTNALTRQDLNDKKQCHFCPHTLLQSTQKRGPRRDFKQALSMNYRQMCIFSTVLSVAGVSLVSCKYWICRTLLFKDVTLSLLKVRNCNILLLFLQLKPRLNHPLPLCHSVCYRPLFISGWIRNMNQCCGKCIRAITLSLIP